MISCYFGLSACIEVTSECTINFCGSERRVKSLSIVSIVTIGAAEEVSDSAKKIVEISAAERFIITRS